MPSPKKPAATKRRPGRPTLDPTGAARVVLPPQRVRADTLAWLQRHPKGIGQAIDAAVTAEITLHAELRARYNL